MILYLHGYRSSADQTWREYRLPVQFRACKQNALYVVPDSVQDGAQSLPNPSLTELLREVFHKTRIPRPPGPIVVIGHSGAFRQIVPWLDYTAIDHVILLDALYGASDKFAWWLEEAKGHEANKLTLVGEDTVEQAEEFLRHFKGVERLQRVPARWEDFTRRQRTARIVYIKSQYGHMALVTSGKVIPLLLRRTPLELL